MAEKKETDAKKKTAGKKGTASKAAASKKKPATKKPATKKPEAKRPEVKDVAFFGETLSHNDVSKENAERFSETEVKVVDMQEKQGGAKSDRKRYVFVAKYDNIVLDGVKLNNLKCDLYECVADSLDDAFAAYRVKLADVTSDVDGLLRKLFGKRIMIEVYDDEKVVSDTIEL